MPKKKKGKPPKSTKEKILAFRKAYAETANIVAAAKLSGVDRHNHYYWMRKYPKYAERWKVEQQLAGEYLEAECIDRATKGRPEPVFYQGKKCGQVRRYSDGLAQFLLRGLLPDKYGIKAEISGPQGQPIQGKIEIVYIKPGDTDGSPQQS